MRENPYAKLFYLMYKKCQREGWYGPNDFKRRRVAWARPLAFTEGFAFPPATEEQLQESERVLGFPLPPLLRQLYAHLANGGFGPGAGLRGAAGGYGDVGTFESGTDESLLKFHRGRLLIDLDHAVSGWRQLAEKGKVDVPADVWPRQLIPICDLGCIQEICLDREGHVYLRASSERDFVYLLKSTGLTLEQWLLQWLDS